MSYTIIATFEVDLLPKGRAKHKITSKGKRVTFTPTKTRKKLEELKWVFQDYIDRNDKTMIPKNVELRMGLLIWTTCNRGDFDNYEKMVSDAGNRILYYDDKQIVENYTRLYRKCNSGLLTISLMPSKRDWLKRYRYDGAPTFPDEVVEYAVIRSGYCCEKCGVHLSKVRWDPHHGIPNTKTNRGLHGEELQSKKNIYILCTGCHGKYKHEFNRFRKDL